MCVHPNPNLDPTPLPDPDPDPNPNPNPNPNPTPNQVGTPVRVTCISPGAVNTEFSTVRLGNKGDADKVCMYTARTPHMH